MTLFTDPQDIDAYGQKLAQLLLIGGYQLESKTAHRKHVRFDTWSQAVQAEAVRRGIEPSPDQLRWLWETLKSEPATRSSYGKLMKDGTDIPPVKVLPKGSRFEIRLGNITAGIDRAPNSPNRNRKPEVFVIIDGDLYMKRGKKNHLECSPVPVQLHMRIFGEVGDTTAEAEAIKIKPDYVTVEGNLVNAKLSSLNEAYTKSSMRLEPHRKAYGGRAYTAVFWIDSHGNHVSLGKIRDEVERGRWTCPDLSLTDEE